MRMAERRAVTLLDLAIAASVAVVPVLLGVLLFVAEIRPSDPGARRAGDRYISVRQVAALKTFERAIVHPSVIAPVRHITVSAV